MQAAPRFKVGDLVSAKTATPKRVGRVVKIYDYADETRVVVKFDDSSEAVFFESELTLEKI